MASTTIQLASSFDQSAVCFSKLQKNKMGGKAVYLSLAGNNKIYLQFPYMRAPFGLSAFTDENTKRTSYSLDVSFNGANDSASAELEQRMRKLDELILNTVVANGPEWLGKTGLTADVLRATGLYKPIVKTPNQPEYPCTVKFKVMTGKNGNFIPEAYNHKREAVAFDSIEKGQRLMSIVEVSQIWFIGTSFGVSMKLQQVLLEPSKKLPTFAFQNVETSNDDDEEDDNVDI